MLFVEISTLYIADIHSRVSEALISIIDKFDGGFPKNNYVIIMKPDNKVYIGMYFVFIYLFVY